MAVYFVECNGKVKIGYSENPESRASGFQTGNPEEVTLIGYIEEFGRDEEKLLHSMFKEYHYRGEWYNYTNEIKKIIKRMMKSCEVKSEQEESESKKKEYVLLMGKRYFMDEFSMEYEEFARKNMDFMLSMEDATLPQIERSFRLHGFRGNISIKVLYIPYWGSKHFRVGFAAFYDVSEDGKTYVIMNEESSKEIGHLFRCDSRDKVRGSLDFMSPRNPEDGKTTREFVFCKHEGANGELFLEHSRDPSWLIGKTKFAGFQSPLEEEILQTFKECGWTGDGGISIKNTRYCDDSMEGCGFTGIVYSVEQGESGISYLMMEEITYLNCIDKNVVEYKGKFEIKCKLTYGPALYW